MGPVPIDQRDVKPSAEKVDSCHLVKQWQNAQICEPLTLLQHASPAWENSELEDCFKGVVREILQPGKRFQGTPMSPEEGGDTEVSEKPVPGSMQTLDKEVAQHKAPSGLPLNLRDQTELQELCHLNLHQKLGMFQQNRQLRWEVGILRQQGRAMRRYCQTSRRGLQEKAEELRRVQVELEISKKKTEQSAQLQDEQLADLQDREAKLAELQVENGCLKKAEAALKREAESLEVSLRKEIAVLKEAGEFQQKVSKDLRKLLGEREDAIEKLEQLQQHYLQQIDDAQGRNAESEQRCEELQRECKEAQQARRWLEQHVAELQQQLASLRATWDTSMAAAREKLALTAAENAEKFGRVAADQAERLGHAAADQAERLGRAAAEQAEQLGRAAAEQANKFSSVAIEQGEKIGRAVAEQASMQSRLQSLEQRLGEALRELHAASARAHKAEEGHAKVQSELRDTRLAATSQLESAKRQAEADCRRLTRQAKAWQARAHDEEERAGQLLRAEEDFRRQQQAAFDLERLELESQVQRLRREVASIHSRLHHGVRAIVTSPEFVVQTAL